MSGEPAGSDDAFDRLRRRVLWSMPTGLYVIGSRGELEGEPRWNLMTANLVVQVATGPKLVAVAVDATAFTRRLVEAGGCFSVSLLDRQDKALVRKFVKPVEPDAVTFDPGGRPQSLNGEAVALHETGAPVLARAVAWIDCEVRHRLDLGSHHLFVGEVVGAGADDEEAAVLRMEDTRMHYGG